MNTVIYTVRTEDHYRFGFPACHLLDEPSTLSRAWITRAEYILPDGYTTSRCKNGTLEIYNAAGKHCPLADSGYHGNGGGTPCIIDIDASPRYIKLDKVCDLPW